MFKTCKTIADCETACAKALQRVESQAIRACNAGNKRADKIISEWMTAKHRKILDACFYRIGELYQTEH